MRPTLEILLKVRTEKRLDIEEDAMVRGGGPARGRLVCCTQSGCKPVGLKKNRCLLLRPVTVRVLRWRRGLSS